MNFIQLVENLKNNYKIGYNTAKKAKNNIVYYTEDAPNSLLENLQDKRLISVKTTSDKFAKKLGKKYLVHFIIL